MNYDNDVLDYFLSHQRQLFPEEVASTREEAEEVLEECFAVICTNMKELKDYLSDIADISGMSSDELTSCEEVFTLPDGRFLVLDA